MGHSVPLVDIVIVCSGIFKYVNSRHLLDPLAQYIFTATIVDFGWSRSKKPVTGSLASLIGQWLLLSIRL
ncbi:unnamed protein product [Acidithrix sp. C25]|nr:unnamed protein product [Acidithrix sp. C25]